MGFFRFRKSFSIFPGVRWNLNKGGSSFTFGIRGLKHTIGNKGSRTTVGIPGTGLSYTTLHGSQSPQPSTLPMKKDNKAGCFYLAGAMVLGIWLIGKCSDSGSSSRSTSSNPTPPPNMAISATPEVPEPGASPPSGLVAHRESSIARFPVASTQPPSKAKSRSAIELARIQKFVPSSVVLTESLGFPNVEKGQTIGVSAVAKGTRVKLAKVSGSRLLLDYNGSMQTVPITSTDFLEQVIAEAEK